MPPIPVRLALFCAAAALSLHTSFGTQTRASGEEALQNGGFETGITRWNLTDGTLIQDAAHARSGSFGAAFTHSNIAAQGFYQTFPIDAARRYTTLGYCIKNHANLTTVTMELRWFASADGTGSVIARNSATLSVSSSSFQPLTIGSVQPPGTARSARLVLLTETSGGAAPVYCDDFSVTSDSPTSTPTKTSTPIPTATLTPTPSAATETPAPTPAATIIPTPVPTALPTTLPTPVPTALPTTPPTATATPSPTYSPTLTATTTPLLTTLHNGGFELGDGSSLAGWESTGGTLKRSGGAVFSGSYGSEFTFSGAVTESFFQRLQTVAGKLYRLSGYCTSPSASLTDLRLQMTWFGSQDGTGAQVGPATSSQSLLPSASGYQLLTTSSTTPPVSAHSMRAGALAVSSGGPAQVFCDEFVLEIASMTVTPTATATVTPTRTPRPVSGGGGGAPFVPPTAVSTSTLTPTAIATPFPRGVIVVSEVLYNPGSPGRDTAQEWIELENLSALPAEARGWSISDNVETDILPDFTIPPLGLALIVAQTGAVLASMQDEPVVVAVPDGSIGNGLANTGDRVILRDGSGQILDALSWGTDRTVNNPACPTAASGQSLQRARDGSDGCSFVVNPRPSPGRHNVLVTATPSPSPTPTPTFTSTPTRTPAATLTSSPSPSPVATQNVTNTPISSPVPTSAVSLEIPQQLQPQNETTPVSSSENSLPVAQATPKPAMTGTPVSTPTVIAGLLDTPTPSVYPDEQEHIFPSPVAANRQETGRAHDALPSWMLLIAGSIVGVGLVFVRRRYRLFGQNRTKSNHQ